MATIRVGLAQLNVTVGDLDANAEQLLAALRDGADQGCDVVVTPELSLVGYPPEDLLLKDGFVEDAVATLEKLAAASPACLGIVGTVLPADTGIVAARRPADARDVAGAAARVPRRHLVNAAALVGAGRLHGAVAKRRLPNYSVFDEQRWFLPGDGEVVPYAVGSRSPRRGHLRGPVGRRGPGPRARPGGLRAAGRAQRVALLPRAGRGAP